MKQKTKVHRWTSKSQYFDVENGEEISRQNALKNYNILKTRKTVKIENYHGYINYEHECSRKNQLKLF